MSALRAHRSAPLKHAEVNITEGLVFLTRVAAQGASHVVNQHRYAFRPSRCPQALRPLSACYGATCRASPRRKARVAAQAEKSRYGGADQVKSRDVVYDVVV
jgi:hypothetical protein